MVFNFISWIFSWWKTTPLTITEDPIKYLVRMLKSDGSELLYIRKGSLYYNICPPTYDICIHVHQDMSSIMIDNNIACVRSILHDTSMPNWPKFTGNQPSERWTTSCLLYFAEVS